MSGVMTGALGTGLAQAEPTPLPTKEQVYPDPKTAEEAKEEKEVSDKKGDAKKEQEALENAPVNFLAFKSTPVAGFPLMYVQGDFTGAKAVNYDMEGKFIEKYAEVYDQYMLSLDDGKETEIAGFSKYGDGVHKNYLKSIIPGLQKLEEAGIVTIKLKGQEVKAADLFEKAGGNKKGNSFSFGVGGRQEITAEYHIKKMWRDCVQKDGKVINAKKAAELYKTIVEAQALNTEYGKKQVTTPEVKLDNGTLLAQEGTRTLYGKETKVDWAAEVLPNVEKASKETNEKTTEEKPAN